MVIISRDLLFKILQKHFWHDVLNLKNVLKFKQVLEDEMTLSFEATEKDLYILRAELYRLKQSGLRAKSKGGIQFKRFLQGISLSKYSWMVPIQRHECEIKIAEQSNLFKQKIVKLEQEKQDVEKKFVEFVKNANEGKKYFAENQSKANVPATSSCRSAGKTTPNQKRKPFMECSASAQSKRRKLEKDMCKDALKFLTDRGVKPVAVVVNRHGKEEVFNLFEKEEANDENDENELSKSDIDEVNTLLYILDSFNISREAYHEMSMIYKTLPRRHTLQKYISNLNSTFEIMNTPDGLGVQQSLKRKLRSVMSNILSADKSFVPDGKLILKISGDGTNVGKYLHVVNVTFTILNENKCGSSDGNYPLCILSTKEKYSELAIALQDLRQEVSELQNSKFQIEGRDFEVKILLGGDYKFLLVSVGIGCISSKYACLYCKCSKNERCDLQKEWSMVDISKGARCEYKCDASASEARRKRKSDSCFSVTNEPLFPVISPLEVVIDPLHLYLRVSDKLFNLLVAELRTLDNISAQTTFSTGVFDRNKYMHISKLEENLKSVGLTFELNINRDTKKLEYRDFNGPEKRILFKKFRVTEVFENERGERAQLIQNIWDGFVELYDLINMDGSDPDEIRKKSRQWCSLYTSAYQERDVTPYIHMLRYHVCELVAIYGNFSKFSQQGLEKLNDNITKQYFRGSNHRGHSALKQVLEKQNRMSELKTYKRIKEKVMTCSKCGGQDHNKIKCMQ